MTRANHDKLFLTLACLTVLAVPTGGFAAKIGPEKAKAGPDGKTLWYDSKDLVVEGKGWSDTKSFYDRLPAKAEGKVPRPVWGLGRDSTGLCVRFTTDSPAIQVRWTLTDGTLAMPHMPATGVSGVDLYAQDRSGGWHFVNNGRPQAITNTASFSPPAGAECMLYLPLYNGVRSVEIGISKGRTISTPEAGRNRKSVVFYGTSITQGGCASRPGMAWTAIAGRQLDAAVINLGFSGNGRMEPVMADLLAELNPSVYVLDCLANMSPQEVSERVEPFVRKLRAAHPDTPIVLAEDASIRNAFPTAKGRIVRAIYQKLKAEGVKDLHFLPARDLLGDDEDATVDGAHPSDLGMLREASVFAKCLAPILRATPK